MLKKIFSLILSFFLLYAFSFSIPEASAENIPANKKVSKKNVRKSHPKKRAVRSKKKKKRTAVKKGVKKRHIRKSNSSYSSPEHIDSQREWLDKQIDKYNNHEDI